MWTHRPRPDILTQTLTVSQPPSAKMLGRIIQRFAGQWMLSQVGWDWSNGLCHLDLTWRSDVQQQLWAWSVRHQKKIKTVRLYDDISRTDRLRLWLLTVESAVRRLLRRDK